MGALVIRDVGFLHASLLNFVEALDALVSRWLLHDSPTILLVVQTQISCLLGNLRRKTTVLHGVKSCISALVATLGVEASLKLLPAHRYGRSRRRKKGLVLLRLISDIMFYRINVHHRMI